MTTGKTVIGWCVDAKFLVRTLADGRTVAMCYSRGKCMAVERFETETAAFAKCNGTFSPLHISWVR